MPLLIKDPYSFYSYNQIIPRAERYQYLTEAQENWLYYLGETFCFWSGPVPPKSHPRYNEILALLQQNYHSLNVVEQAVQHYVGSLVGKPFNWYLVRRDGKRDKNAEKIENEINNWWK